MSTHTTMMGKATAVALSVALLFGMGPDAYGMHHCVHHQDASHSSGSALGSSHCTMDCPGCLQSAPHIAGVALESAVPDPPTVVDPTAFTRGPLGPRHGLYEFHLPNAPPTSA